MKAITFLLLVFSLLFVGCGKLDLDDTKTIERILTDAIDLDKLQLRGKEGDKLAYTPNSQTSYTGWVKEMYSNGQVEALARYQSGKLVSRTEWHENGEKQEEASFKDGELDGPRTSWYENAQKKEEASFKNAEAHGPITRWYENGLKKNEGNIKDGEEHGPYFAWYENGQKQEEGNYKSGELDGLRTLWYENGQKQEEAKYKSGELDGLRTLWYENGQKKWETKYKDGEAHGPLTAWYENGHKKEDARYKDGELDGPSTLWYENGQKKAEAIYNDGKLDGLLTLWYENGQKKEEAKYKVGEIDGPRTMWHKDGKQKLAKEKSDALDKKNQLIAQQMQLLLEAMKQQPSRVESTSHNPQSTMIVCPNCGGTGKRPTHKNYNSLREEYMAKLTALDCMTCKGKGVIKPGAGFGL